jgi:hypothetical protein
MSDTAVIAMEVSFNVLYLISIYVLVVIMYRRYREGAAAQKGIEGPFLLAFFLLAVGDTGHVGFRVAAYALGGLEQHSILVGFGALATAITVTFFYLLMVEVWQRQTGGARGAGYWLLMGLGIVRLVIMALPGNSWGEVVPPLGYSYLRNAPLTAVGLTIAFLLMRLARERNMGFNRAAAVCIFVSFAFYLPVILFIRSVPMLGMLMIPKTVAYVALAGYGIKYLFRPLAVRGNT